MVQDYQEKTPVTYDSETESMLYKAKQIIDSELILMKEICNPCEQYKTCILDPPKECEVFKKEVQKRRN